MNIFVKHFRESKIDGYGFIIWDKSDWIPVEPDDNKHSHEKDCNCEDCFYESVLRQDELDKRST